MWNHLCLSFHLWVTFAISSRSSHILCYQASKRLTALTLKMGRKTWKPIWRTQDLRRNGLSQSTSPIINIKLMGSINPDPSGAHLIQTTAEVRLIWSLTETIASWAGQLRAWFRRRRASLRSSLRSTRKIIIKVFSHIMSRTPMVRVVIMIAWARILKEVLLGIWTVWCFKKGISLQPSASWTGLHYLKEGTQSFREKKVKESLLTT